MDKPEGAPSHQEAIDSIVLEEEIDPNYVPSEAEVIEYAKWLGMDLEGDKDLYWIAREGLMAPLPANWKPCKTKDTEDIYYFNFSTGESTWDHPCDGYYKRLYEEEKKKKEVSLKENNDSKRMQAKQDIQLLTGKKDKKVKKTKPEPINFEAEQKPSLSLAPVIDRKPLPGLKMTLGSIGSATPLASTPSALPQPLSRSSTPERKPLPNDLPAPTLRNSEELFTSQPKSSNSLGISSLSQSKDVSRSDVSLSQQSNSFKEEESVSSSVESTRSHKNFLVHKGLDTVSRKTTIESAFEQPVVNNNNFSNEDKRVSYEDTALLKEQLSKLQDENSKLLYKISFHEVELKNSKQELDSMSQRLEKMRLLEDELSKTKLELRSRESDLIHHQNRATQMEGENRKLLDQISQKDQELYQLKTKNMESINTEISKFQQLDLQHNQLKFTLTMKDQECERISKELSSLKVIYDQLLQSNTASAATGSGVAENNDNLVKTFQLQSQQQQQQLKQAQDQISQLQQQLLQQQSTDQQSHQQIQQQLSSAQHKIQQLEIENKSYQENIRQQQKDLLHLQQKQSNSHPPAVETVVDTQSQIQLQQKILELQHIQEKCKLLEAQYQTQLQQVTKLEMENSQLQMKLSTVSSSSSTNNQMIEQLQKQQTQQMQQAQDHIGQLQQQLSQLQSKDLQSQQQLSQSQFRVQQLEGEAKLQQQNVQLKESEISQLKQQIQLFSQQLADLQQNQQLTVGLSSSSSNNNQLVSQLQLQVQQQMLDMQQLQEKCKLLENQYQNQVQQNSQLEVEHSQLQMKLSAASSNVTMNTQFIEQLQQQLNQSQQKCQQLELDYRTLQLEQRKLQDEIQTLNFELQKQAMVTSSPTANLHQQQIDLQQLQEKCKLLEAQYQAQLQQATQLEVENSQLQIKLSSATANSTMNSQFVEQLQKQQQQQLKQAQDQISQLQQQLLQQQSTDQQSHQQIQQQLSSAQHKIQQLEIENKSYQENIRQQQKDILQLQQKQAAAAAVVVSTEPSVSMQEFTQVQLQLQQKSSEFQQVQEKCKLLETQYQTQLQQSNEQLTQLQQQVLSQQLAQQSKDLSTQQELSQLKHKNQQLEMKVKSYQDTITQLQQQIQQQQQYILQINTNTNAAAAIIMPPPVAISATNAFEAKLNSVAASDAPKLSLEPSEKSDKRAKRSTKDKKKKKQHGQSIIKKELPLAESPIYYTSDQSWEYSSSDDENDRNRGLSSDRESNSTNQRKNNADVDDLTSVSEVQTTPVGHSKHSSDANKNILSMAQVISNLTDAIYHLKLYNAPTNRDLARHLVDSNQRSSSSSSSSNASIRQLLEQRSKDETWFYDKLLDIMQAAKSYIRKHRHQIQHMKQSWKKKKSHTEDIPEKDAINVATRDINLVIRFLRQLQSSISIRKEQLSALKHVRQSKSITSQSGKSVSLSRELIDQLKTIFHKLDEDVSMIYEEINVIARAFISSSDTVSSPAISSPDDYLRLESPIVSASAVPHNNLPHYPPENRHYPPYPYPDPMNPPPAAYYYPHPVINPPPSTTGMIPQHVLDGKKLLMQATAAGTGPSGAKSSSAVTYIPNIDLEHQLQSVTNQLNSAQYKQRECIQHFDRHRDWLGGLLKEVGKKTGGTTAIVNDENVLNRLKSKSSEEMNIPYL